jgi:FtsZ-binding cell division protein ZapB
MPEPSLGDRLEELEKAVRRAAETIAVLRRERETLQTKLTTGEGDRAELQRLRQERKDMLSQINGMLRDMEKLDL